MPNAKQTQAAGVKFGRKPKLSDYQRKEAIKRRGCGRDLGGDRQVLRRRHLDDLAMVVNEPEREIEGPPMRRPFEFMLRSGARDLPPSTVRVHRRI